MGGSWRLFLTCIWSKGVTQRRLCVSTGSKKFKGSSRRLKSAHSILHDPWETTTLWLRAGLEGRTPTCLSEFVTPAQ